MTDYKFYSAALAVAFFISGVAFLFVVMLVLDVSPREIVFPQAAFPGQGPLVQGPGARSAVDSRPVSQPAGTEGSALALTGPMFHEAVRASTVSTGGQDGIDTGRNNAIISAIREVSPAVVSIGITVQRRYITPYYDDYLGYFYRGRNYSQYFPKVGTGFIVNGDGVIVTNYHVIEGGTEVVVTLQDGREIKGNVVGSDRTLDIAVIKIEGVNLPYAVLGDSDDLIIGEWAIAIGNPFGTLLQDNSPTVTVGVISAVDRRFSGSAEEGRYYQNMIQTDAAINPGNSGGPLVNSLGQVVGINTFIFTKSGGNIGLGFAIPINTVKRVVREILTHGKVRTVWLGFQGQEISRLTASALGLSTTDGVIVTYVEADSPAADAGLQRGDVILEMDGVRVVGASDANAKLHALKVGDVLHLKVLREDRSLDIDVTAKEQPS
jgi:serine protease Do